jgi:V8-like Glu-specific endopeptidase
MDVKMTWKKLLRRELPLLLIYAATSVSRAQTTAPDKFVSAIEAMKHSLTTLVCLTGTGRDAEPSAHLGTGFFVSVNGDFITAAHVIFADVDHGEFRCKYSAALLPLGGWTREAPDEEFAWFEFMPSECKTMAAMDLVRCKLPESSAKQPSIRIEPAAFDENVPPDGSEVAFTGFPLRMRDPVTSRAFVATYRVERHGMATIPRIVLDRSSWPGSSGSPVYLSNGRVIGVVVEKGTGEAEGITLVRPAGAFREILDGK